MARGVNKVILLGNLGKDPEVKYTQSGMAVARFSLATTERAKDKDGNWNDKTEWHNVVAFGRTAEVAGEYLKKGRSVYIEGRLQTRKYTDKDGVEKYATDIRVDQMQMLGSRQGQGAPAGDDDYGQGGGGYSRPAAPAPRPSTPAPRQAPSKSASGFDDMDDDIPF